MPYYLSISGFIKQSALLRFRIQNLKRKDKQKETSLFMSLNKPKILTKGIQFHDFWI